jgi:hypothetical protein
MKVGRSFTVDSACYCCKELLKALKSGIRLTFAT